MMRRERREGAQRRLVVVAILDDDLACRLQPIHAFLATRYAQIAVALFDRFNGAYDYGPILDEISKYAPDVAIFSNTRQWRIVSEDDASADFIFLLRHNHVIPQTMLIFYFYLLTRAKNKTVNLFNLIMIRHVFIYKRSQRILFWRSLWVALKNMVLYPLFFLQSILCYQSLFRILVRLAGRSPSSSSPRAPQKILFMRMDHLGDMICTLPSVAAIRRHYPDSHLTMLVASWNAAPIQANRHLYDDLLVWDAPWHDKASNYRLGPVALYRFLRFLFTIRRRKFDLVIQPRGEGMNVTLAALCKGSYVVSGIDPLRPLSRRMQRFIDLPVIFSPLETLHIAQWPERCLNSLGIKITHADIEAACSHPEDREITAEINSCRRRQLAVCVMVVAAGSPIRQWPAAKFARLIEILHASKIAVFLVGAKTDQPVADEIRQYCRVPFANLIGKTNFNNLPWLLWNSDYIISLDTSIMHLASLLGKKVIAIFGAGKLALARPIFHDHCIVKKELGCSGCGDGCLFRKRSPPFCLQRITPTDVAACLGIPPDENPLCCS